ncbi:hypothetical protein [Fictibacillus phosphorivorans]|uniref:hypothetical protein n=1 Tax=Fictibacillus phosphorivorans TaxID=1221500 RepID=UPI0011A71414|nr:hypothetical protein [Fictibacillus phosphorivorans]
MAKNVLYFFVASFISFILLIAGLLIWVSRIPTRDPSDADGKGFAIVYGFMAAVPTSIIIGLIVTIGAYAYRKYKERG